MAISLGLALFISLCYIVYNLYKKRNYTLAHSEIPGTNECEGIEMVELPRVVDPDIQRESDQDGVFEIDLNVAEDTERPLTYRNYRDFPSTLEEGQNLVQQQQRGSQSIISAEVYV